MTREEAIKMLKSKMDGNTDTSYEWAETVRMAIKALKQESKTGHWKLVQRGKVIDVCCSNCEAVRIKGYAYNYTIDELNNEDINECFGSAEMRFCPNCGSDNREVKE